MVHVLEEIHRALLDGGVLLDVHPVPRHATVAVRTRDSTVVIGSPDDSVGIAKIRTARRSRNRVVRDGLFRVEARRWFDLPVHYPSVDAWRARLEGRLSTSIVSDALMTQARRAMRAAGSTLVVTERVCATRLASWSGETHTPEERESAGRYERLRRSTPRKQERLESCH